MQRLLLILFTLTSLTTAHAALDFIRVGPDGRHFSYANSGTNFTPWGFNYDHDRSNRLIETYWLTEWDTVTQDFAEMKSLGANTVRIHLQVSRFMNSPAEPNQPSLHQLARLLDLANQTGLYLDLTGLGCYDKADVPQWFNDLDETRRWEVQARFWDAVSAVCAQSPAVFCYDLINEPILAGDKTNRDWTPGAFGDRYFVQRLVLDAAGRTDAQIARSWINQMTDAIHQRDRRHLITIGEIPWALTFPGAKSLFHSPEVGTNLNFVSVHFYPQKGEVNKALSALRAYDIGKPIVIEETFPLKCPVEDLAQFIEQSKTVATGWIGFYWGKTIAEYRQDQTNAADSLTLHWLEYFAKKSPEMQSNIPRHP